MNDFKRKVSNINEAANIWMHRCNHYGKSAWEMLGYDYNKKVFSDENGCYISIGCGSGRWNIEKYKTIKSCENQRQEFENYFTGSNKPRYRHFLYRFFFEFKKDDYIVVPSGGEFHVFQIDSDEILTYDDKDNGIIRERFEKIGLKLDDLKKQKDDFKYFRKVKPIRVQIPRKGYAIGEFNSKLKYRGTNLEITDTAAEEFKNALKADGPFSIYDRTIEQLKEELYNNALKKLTPDQLENLISWYFKKKGADIYEILKKNYSDKVEKEDVDVLGIFEDLKLRFFVQSKAYIGDMELKGANEQIKKYIEYHVLGKEKKYTDIKWIICLAKSDKEIKDLENINNDIRVINGMEFAEMLLRVGLQNIDEALN